VGDVHPYYENGTYHLIYVYDPGDWRVGQLRSVDLLHWEEREMSHTPAPVIPKVLPNYYVLQIIPDAIRGGYRTFYPYYGIRASRSRDLADWQQADPPLAVPSLAGYGRMADPYPFWNEDRREYWMVVTLRKDGLPRERAGAFGYATSADLAHWTWRGELYSPSDMAEPELPSMFKMAQQWYLLGFPNDGKTLGEPTYRVSSNSSGPWTVPVPDRLDGRHFCAGRTSFDGRRRLLFGWIPRSVLPSGSQHWGGHLALPRQLHQLPDGRLAVRLEPSVAKRIRGEAWFPKDGAGLVPQAGRWRINAAGASASHSGRHGAVRIQPAPPRIDLALDLTLRDDSDCAGIVLGQASSGAGYEVVVDSRSRRLAVMNRDGTVRVQQATAGLQGRKVRLQVLVDDDLVEAFLDDQYALAARMPESVNGASVDLFARGAADFENIGLYRLLALEEIENPQSQR
jgi:beta-fructofuranosidase